MRNLKTQHLRISQPICQIASVTTRVLTTVILVLAGSYAALAQEPTASPTATPSAEETRLTEQNKILALEKTNAELKKGIRDAQPQPSATALEGKTTIDENVVIETQMVTYKAMSDVAERIGSEIHGKFGGARAIAIYDAEELQNLKHYRSAAPVIEGRVQGLKQGYVNAFTEISKDSELGASTISLITVTTNSVSSMSTESVSPSIVGGLNGIGNGLKAFADVLALMRTDTEIKGKTVKVEESAMVAEAFRALRNKFGNDVRLYYPAVVSPDAEAKDCAPAIADGSTQTPCPILSSLAGLSLQKERAEKLLLEKLFDVTSEFDKMTRKKAGATEDIKALSKQIDDLNLERLHAELEKPWMPAQVSRFEKFINEFEVRKAAAIRDKNAAETRLASLAKQKNLLESLQSLNQQADEMVAALAKPDEKAGTSELANFLRAENMNNAIGEDGYWLEFRAISAGGNNRTRRNLFRYFSGAKLDHSGGIVVEWALYDPKGAIVASNKDSSYGGYQTPKEIQSAKFQDAVTDTPPRPTPVIAKSGKQ